ncbi:MAG: fibronectin type III domain-containing protein, partial [Actinomycetes bacterium]
GTSPSSRESNLVKPIDVPGPPAIVGVTEDDSQVTVSWTAPSDIGGSPITNYTVSSDPGSMTCQSTTTLSCTVSGLSNGTAYRFTVAATNEAGTGPQSAESSPKTPRGKPQAPSLSVKKTTSRSISISWSAVNGNGSDVKYYTVTTQPGGDSQKVDGLSFDFATTDSSTAFSFVVTATNDAGEGDQSDSTPSVRATDGPQPPSNLRATSIGDGSVTVAWAAPQPTTLANNQNITGYKVTASPGDQTCTAEATATDCVVDGLTNGSSYSFVVVAQSSDGESPPSATVEATPSGAPGQPVLAPGVAGDAQVQLSWSVSTDGGSPITRFIIEIQTAGGPWSTVADADLMCESTTATTCAVTGLTNGTDYSFRVTAANAGAKSQPSESQAVTPTALPPP